MEEVNEQLPNATLKQKQEKAKTIQANSSSEKWRNHIKSLVVQGRFLDIVAEESKSSEWNSIVYNLPNRVSKFFLNSVTDTLNTRANLQRWGKSMSSKCKACGNHETLHHVLNNCTKFLDQGRYTWRHNNVLGYIHNYLKASLKDGMILNCDMGNMNGASTVPVSCTVTNLIPDICLFSTEERKLTVIELTIPFELNITSAHERKCNKYSPLLSDIESNGIETEFIGLEIGSRGFISSENEKRLKQIFKLGNSASFKNFKLNISKLSINSSFVIFNVRNEPEWDNLPLLTVPYGN